MTRTNDQRIRGGDETALSHGIHAPPFAVDQWLSPARQLAFANDVKALVITLLLGLLLWTLAYQVSPHVHLAVGGDVVTQRRKDDVPFLTGVHAAEPSDAGRAVCVAEGRANCEWWEKEPGYTYRWTTSNSAIALPGIGGGQWIITMAAVSGRPGPGNILAMTTWQTGHATLPPLPISADRRSYHILAESDRTGDLVLRMNTQPYESSSDPRELGFALRDVSIAPTYAGVRFPAWPQLGWLALTLVCVYTLVRWLALALRPALMLSIALTLLATVLLVTNRFALTLFTPALAGLSLGCVGMALVAQAGLSIGSWRLARSEERPRSRHRQADIVLALFLLAFALRLGGMLHPYAMFSDHRLNANNLLEFGLGDVYFTEGLPAEAGGGDAPYPPGTYLLTAPLQLLFSPNIDSRVLVVQSGVAFLDSLVLVLVWAMLSQAGLGQRAALCGAAFYLAPAPIMGSFSVGEYANIGGQVLAMPAIGFLAWSVSQRAVANLTSTAPAPSRHFPHIWLWLPLLCIGLLGHLGITISFGLLLASVWVLALIGWGLHRRWADRSGGLFDPRTLTLAGGLAVIVVTVLYYSAPEFWSFFGQRLSGATGADEATETLLLPSIVTLIQNVFAPYRRLAPLLIISSLMGLVLLLNRCALSQRVYGLPVSLVAWWLSTICAIGFPLFLDASQGVRWAHFLYPALCLGAGPFLATLWQRGTVGRIAARVVLLAPISYGLIVWIEQIRDYPYL